MTAIPLQSVNRRLAPTSSSRKAPKIRHPGSGQLGIPCRLCYKPAERLSNSLDGSSHDDGMGQRSTSSARLTLAGVLCSLAVTGCLSPITLNRVVTMYDEAVTDAISKQLLINIARAHQHQPIHFTGVSNIAATFDFRVSAGATPALTGDASRALMPIFGGSMAENPTISIVPIEGEEFTKRLLTPFQETKFILLLRQRYDIDLMLRLMTQELRIRQNGEEIAYRNRPADRTEYEMFRRVVSRLSAIQDQNQLHAEPFVYHRTWTISANSVTAEGFQALQKEYLVTYSQKDNTYTLRKQIIGRTLITNYDPDILSPDERAIWSTKRRKGISTMCPSTSARSASEGTTLSREISGCEASIPFSTFCADRLKKTPNTTSTKIRAPRRSTKIPSTPWNSCCWMERPRESTCRFSPMENITP